MNQNITLQTLTAAAFAPFGDVLEASGEPDKIINAGMCGRYHDRAKLDFINGRASINLFNATPRSLPYSFNLIERHPDGSQAFVPMSEHPFIVIVAPNEGAIPGEPQAFVTKPGQAINFHRGTWHGVLTPLQEPGLFAVVDRVGPSSNLEEYIYSNQYVVQSHI
ncbi:ureidoglycolate lyase [Pseudopelagicola sp. nBUS_19]|uniref:ureidoglycolate lyase n=1 Tax=Pseudopelagicola sp. nBUS_19 TaxID=3395316 RepID=UPI003EBED49D